jgi:predicted TIM-barrel fold metal-dependent hydrolase
MIPPLLALEEHFFSSAGEGSATKEKYVEQFKHVPGIEAQLRDLEDFRLDEMAKGGISMQIVSHCPGTLSVEQAVSANNQLAQAVKKHPNRLAGFAVLSMAHPQHCVDELERCIKQLGFVGALVDNHVNGRYYDGEEYDIFWSKAEELGVPIYLHPTWPSDLKAHQMLGNFTAGASRSLGSSGWGWHSDVGLHVLRLHAASVFEKFPKLKIIIGHFGEMLPFMLQRVCNLSVRWGEQKKSLKEVWDENIWVTTSGVWSLDPLRCMLHNTKIERILFSVDYPFEKNENGLRWMKELEASGLVTQDQLEMIAYKNGEVLLGIRVSG